MKVKENVSSTMADSRPQNISREQLGQFVRSKKHFYNAMLLAGYVLPSYKQGLVSIKTMHMVRSREVWMPKGEDI